MRAKLRLLALLAFASISTFAATATYNISTDTSAFAGQSGALQFVLSSSGLPPTVNALIDNLLLTGGTPATIPSISLSNASLYDLATIPVVFGSSLSYRLTLTTGVLPNPLVEGTTFTLDLLNPNGDIINGGDDPFVQVDLAPEGFVVTPFNSRVSAVGTTIPEPSLSWLVGAGVAGLLGLRRRAA